jgi:hypothetical protein
VPPAAIPAQTAPIVEAAATAEPAPAGVMTEEPARPKKPRAPRKSRPEDILSAMSSAPAATTLATEAFPPRESEATDLSAEGAPKTESSSSSDGATRLLATAYIGIGNKLFIRGDGPGLTWDTGVPMQFVSIGKWGWFTHDAAGPVRVKLYKNDQIPALSGEILLEPGKHTEATALF